MNGLAEPSVVDIVLKYGIYLSGVFQLMCILSAIFLPHHPSTQQQQQQQQQQQLQNVTNMTNANKHVKNKNSHKARKRNNR